MSQILFEDTLYISNPDHTVGRILEEARLRDVLEAQADRRISEGAWGPTTAAESIRLELLQYIRSLNRSDLPSTSYPGISLGRRLAMLWDKVLTFLYPFSGLLIKDIWLTAIRPPWWRRLIGVAAFMLLLPYTSIFTGMLLVVVRLLESNEPDEKLPDSSSQTLQEILDQEDITVINQLTLFAPVKKSWLRRKVLGVVLWGAERGCRHLWDQGSLTGINTIHFARIFQIDHGKHMLFLSDYGGSWTQYLEDFLTVGRRAVIPISTNLRGCPKTRWLFFPTLHFAEQFRPFLQTYQLPLAITYSAYPTLIPANVRDNSRLRQGLFASQLERNTAEAWLRLL